MEKSKQLISIQTDDEIIELPYHHIRIGNTNIEFYFGIRSGAIAPMFFLSIVDNEQAERRRQNVMNWNTFNSTIKSKEDLLKLRDAVNQILQLWSIAETELKEDEL
jgi:hypothetical protein